MIDGQTKTSLRLRRLWALAPRVSAAVASEWWYYLLSQVSLRGSLD